LCDPEVSLVIPISRGGKTLDVNSTLDLFSSFPMIGLSSQGPMFDYLSKKKIPILPVPDLSGRFAASISNVALVPAYLAEIDIDEFLRELDAAYNVYKDLENIEKNIALQFASYLYTQYLTGVRNCFIMPYSSYLEGAAGLFVQEISESSGKQEHGMMGTKQEAPLCQHSVLELLLGGSKGHTLPFLWTTRSEPQDVKIDSLEFGLKNQSAIKIINHQADATFQALLTQKVPSAMLNLSNYSISSIAQLIAFIQSATYYFCLLLDVNWENNPSVNMGKQICNTAIRTSLSKKQRKIERKETAAKQFSDNMT
jgi:glucose-6-phosphate isomerase